MWQNNFCEKKTRSHRTVRCIGGAGRDPGCVSEGELQDFFIFNSRTERRGCLRCITKFWL